MHAQRRLYARGYLRRSLFVFLPLTRTRVRGRRYTYKSLFAAGVRATFFLLFFSPFFFLILFFSRVMFSLISRRLIKNDTRSLVSHPRH